MANCPDHPDCTLLDATEIGARRSERVHGRHQYGNVYEIVRPPAIVHHCALGDLVAVGSIEDHLVIEKTVRASDLYVWWLEERAQDALAPFEEQIVQSGAVICRNGKSVNITMHKNRAHEIVQLLAPQIQAGHLIWRR
jgi:hypothetical protein